MKKNTLIALSLIVLLSGCCKNRDKQPKKIRKNKQKTEVSQNVDIPLASDEVRSYFDDKDDLHLGEFILVEDAQIAQKEKSEYLEGPQNKINNADEAGQSQAENSLHLDEKDLEDFAWVDEIEQADDTFKKCHFEFNKYDVKDDQEKKVKENIELAKKMLDDGESPTIVIEGHSCHSAGSRTYNLVLSEKRAKAIADRFVVAGVPSENIKIVPRGSEVPEKDNFGNDVTGSRYDQWPNRRSEIRVIYS